MGRLPPTAWLWLAATSVTAVALLAVRWFRGDQGAALWIEAGVAVSLATLLASRMSVILFRASNRPLHRLVIETAVRLSIPLSVLLAIAIARRDLLTTTFLLYFLPFQFVTIIADTAGSIWRVKAATGIRSGSEA